MKKIILLVILIGILILGVCGLYFEIREYSEGEEEYEELEKYFQVINFETETENNNISTPQNDFNVETVPNVDFVELKKINGDIVAWIYIPKAGISYPVVQGKDNSYYVTHTFKGSKNKTGAIFLDTYNASDFSDTNSIIYGHNLQNGKMFSVLKKFLTPSYVDSHNEFIIYTQDSEVHYKIFAVFKTDKDGEVYRRNFLSDTSFNEYLTDMKSASLYKLTEEAEIRQIVTLSTCTNVEEDERIVLLGYKIENEAE